MTNAECRKKPEVRIARSRCASERVHEVRASRFVINSSFVIWISSFASFRLLNRITQFRRGRSPHDLTSKNRRRIGRNYFVALQNELGIEPIARWFVNGLAAEMAEEFVFVIVVAAEFEAFTIRRQFLFFV